jgi:hypothetical protein
LFCQWDARVPGGTKACGSTAPTLSGFMTKTSPSYPVHNLWLFSGSPPANPQPTSSLSPLLLIER